MFPKGGSIKGKKSMREMLLEMARCHWTQLNETLMRIKRSYEKDNGQVQ